MSQSDAQSKVQSAWVPQPIPENLWGDRWQFARLTAEDLELRLLKCPIPIREILPSALPSQQQIELDASIPGVVIDAGKQSMRLTRWVAAQRPVSLTAVNRELGALMLDAEGHRWIMTTYQDQDVKVASETFEALKLKTSGIHFLLIQPDNTGRTHSGLWLLRS
jgi:RNA-binding protein Tab2/Atab2